MKFRHGLLVTAAAALGASLAIPGRDRAAVPAAEHPYPGIAYRHEVRKEPAQRLFWATIDLTDPRVSPHVAPAGPDPDGDGKWQTTLTPPTAVARREGFELTVNGDFFAIRKADGGSFEQKPGDPPPAYRAATWATVLGPAATDGRPWAQAAKPRPCLVVKKSGKVTMETLTKAGDDDAQVIAGNVMLVEGGKAVPRENPARHPRTVVGLDAAGTHLTILVLDGRRPGVAEGMSYAELSRELIAAGCDRALNLDGGGSSVMVIRTGDRFDIKNHPSNESERPVANVLGIDVKDAK